MSTGIIQIEFMKLMIRAVFIVIVGALLLLKLLLIGYIRQAGEAGGRVWRSASPNPPKKSSLIGSAYCLSGY
jgi:hypothetical protein